MAVVQGLKFSSFDMQKLAQKLNALSIDTLILEVDTYGDLGWKKKHTWGDTLEIEMTRMTRQLEFCKLQLNYPENISHNNRRTSCTHLHTWVQLCCCNFMCNLELRLWYEIVRQIGNKARQCESGFPKQNAIKSHLRNRLNLKTLDALMRVSICGLEVYAMDWATIFNIWRNMQDRRIITLDWFYFFLVTNQDCILIIQNISFPKILCKPKLRWHFGIKCRWQLTFIFVFKNVTWHFGFEVERQMKFVKHRHWSRYHKPWK